MSKKEVSKLGSLSCVSKSQEHKRTEKQVKDKVKKLIEVFGKYNAVYTLTPMTMGYGESGHPDRLLLLNGVLIGIETKKDKNNHHCRPELKAKSNEVMQQKQAKKIKAAGGVWVCVHSDNLSELVALLDQYAEVKLDNFASADKDFVSKILVW